MKNTFLNFQHKILLKFRNMGINQINKMIDLQLEQQK